ncbi:Ribosome-binding protein 1 (Ribosome receptor protein) (mRRp), putative [Schistosoma mansoni]|nr:Ribosome-binding protein 1 (Ribosome receptor protein) (mRRp), putative [Schistosoma mansoni]|eukprot:XP_018645316.1 Ribosome-binding protein 1 (Ribosome receptor protein) (mRRp), putative [Schistosoma mansoni]
MDCRLQIADLEGRLKAFDATKQELADSQGQCERVRMTLESCEAKLADAERRADEASGLIKIKDSIIVKQSNFTKEIEERLRNITEERDNLLHKTSNLETELNIAIVRGEDADDLKERLKALQELFDNLVNDRSETTSESGLAAANEYFKSEQAKSENRIAELKEVKSGLEQKIEELCCDKKQLQMQLEQQLDEYEKLGEKCATLEARIKEMAHSERRYGGGMLGGRLIGPTLPPWIADDKKLENDLERLSKTDPATLRAKVMELESQVNELNQLLTYREDVILRIHEEISKKASKLEAADVERSSLTAQISILKRELATAREDLARRGVGPIELEAEIERLRSKRDREYQRRKRTETDLENMEKENQELKQRIKRLEEAAIATPPKPMIPQSDPSDRNKIIELQGAVNQLRMDNEAKRSELFDLRSRFDAKSAQVDKMSAEFKTKERLCSELTTQLSNTRGQLENTIKELESVRCRAVRGGAEVERWHSDLTSLQTTNKFLSSQLNDLRNKVIAKDKMIVELGKRCESILDSHPNKANEEPIVNGDKAVCSRCQEHLSTEDNQQSNELDIISQLKAKLSSMEDRCKTLMAEAVQTQQANENLKSQLESELANAQQSVQKLSEEVAREKETAYNSTYRVQELTAQVNQLETDLSQTRMQLLEAQSDHQKENDINASAVAPPAKRTRRSTNAVNNNVKANSKNNQDHQSIL